MTTSNKHFYEKSQIMNQTLLSIRQESHYIQPHHIGTSPDISTM